MGKKQSTLPGENSIGGSEMGEEGIDQSLPKIAPRTS
jgi:hypothetical protein